MISFSSEFIEEEEIIEFLKKEILLNGICQKILHRRIISQVAQEKNITVTSEEIQTEADSIRYGQRLEKVSDTLNWLEEQMVTAEDWEAGIGDRLLAKKLSEHLFAAEVEKYFAQNRANFEQIILYQITLPYEQLAWEVYYQLQEEEISFYEAAHLYDIDERRRLQSGYQGKVSHRSLKADIAPVVFGAAVGEVVGPLSTEQGYHLFMIEAFIPAELTPNRREEILNQLFQDWLQGELNHLLYHSLESRFSRRD